MKTIPTTTTVTRGGVPGGETGSACPLVAARLEATGEGYPTK